MSSSRRSFLTLVVHLIAQMAYPLRVGARSSRDHPAVAHVIGGALLPGGHSTVMLVGSSLQAVRSVVFDSPEVTGVIIDQGVSHAMVRIATTDAWTGLPPHMRLKFYAGRLVAIDYAFVADAARQHGSYGYSPYGRYPRYGERRSLDTEWPAVIGGRLL